MTGWTQYGHLSPDALLHEADRALAAVPGEDRCLRHLIQELRNRYAAQMGIRLGLVSVLAVDEVEPAEVPTRRSHIP